MTRPLIKTKAVKIFEKLQCAKEYRNGFASAKLHIIKHLLADKHELRAFAQAPGRRQYEINGFLMEHCARFSSQLPKNTSKAQSISETIINYLKENRLCNPDHIWLRIQGKHIMITGIGEVKSHPFNVNYKPRQLLLQEDNIRNLIKSHTITSIRYRIALADEFARHLILPRSLNAPHMLPSSTPLGWEIKEIEFTFPEIIFLKDMLITDTIDIKPAQLISPYSPQEYQLFTREIMRRTEEVIIELLHNLLPIDKKDIRNALTAWSLLWNSIPANHESVDLMIQWMRDVKQKNICPLSLIATPPLLLAELDEKENAFYDSLLLRTVNDNVSLTHAFLSRLQEVRKKLPDPPELPKKQEVNLFALL